MATPDEIIEALLDPILVAPFSGLRKVVAIAGPPASGKSTVSQLLAEALTAKGCAATVVPMDGYHLDNRILIEHALLDRKGAPETFDVDGFLRLATTLATSEQAYFPIFDRDRDIAIAGAGQVSPDCQCVIIEGNYLLFDAPVWRDLNKLWDFSVRLDVPTSILRQRLVARWQAYGLTADQAIKRAESNDLRNAAEVSARSLPADVTIKV